MTQLLLNALHVIDLIRAGIGTRSDGLVVLHPEINPRDRVLARQHTYLMCGLVLESG